VRKAAFVPEDGVGYNPDRHQSCSVYAGTTVQQVRPHCQTPLPDPIVIFERMDEQTDGRPNE